MGAGEFVITENRKARHDFHIEEVFEVGMELRGTEVKSLRAGKANLKDSFALIRSGEVFLHNMHISTYEQGNQFNHDPIRVRKLLLHKHEINQLLGAVQRQGLALVPLKVYFKRGKAKLALALGKGKKLYDKRQDMAERDAKREIERSFRERQKS
ncbi:MAG: SsrA-binding protein SmpB [Carboxydocellales bacterium]